MFSLGRDLHPLYYLLKVKFPHAEISFEEQSTSLLDKLYDIATRHLPLLEVFKGRPAAVNIGNATVRLEFKHEYPPVDDIVKLTYFELTEASTMEVDRVPRGYVRAHRLFSLPKMRSLEQAKQLLDRVQGLLQKHVTRDVEEDINLIRDLTARLLAGDYSVLYLKYALPFFEGVLPVLTTGSYSIVEDEQLQDKLSDLRVNAVVVGSSGVGVKEILTLLDKFNIIKKLCEESNSPMGLVVAYKLHPLKSPRGMLTLIDPETGLQLKLSYRPETGTLAESILISPNLLFKYFDSRLVHTLYITPRDESSSTTVRIDIADKDNIKDVLNMLEKLSEIKLLSREAAREAKLELEHVKRKL